MADLITDAKELTKALAHCTDERNTSCEGCPYYSTKESCKSRKNALLIIEFLLNEIEKLKEQQPKKGTWKVKIRHHPYPDGREYKKFSCSVCGNDVDDHEDSDFCPWCGADMRENETH